MKHLKESSRNFAFNAFEVTFVYKQRTHCRPLLLDFPTDAGARFVDDQWMLGDGLMVAPATSDRVTGKADQLWRLAHFPGGPCCSVSIRFVFVSFGRVLGNLLPESLEKTLEKCRWIGPVTAAVHCTIGSGRGVYDGVVCCAFYGFPGVLLGCQLRGCRSVLPLASFYYPWFPTITTLF
jgi:hypothetical protein